MKKLGVIGGLGPLASAYFYEMLIRIQKVRREQEYIDVLLYSKPSTPDRTAYITGVSEVNPAASLVEAGKILALAGADILVMPCVTAHFFYSSITEQVALPMLHIVEETALFIKEKGFNRVGLLATNGTVKGRMFHVALEKQGIEVITPSAEGQATLMEIIYRGLKQGKAVDAGEFGALTRELTQKGAETVILGCTELSLVTRALSFHEGYTDVLGVLARAALKHCGVKEMNKFPMGLSKDD